MTSTELQTLFDSSNCYRCFGLTTTQTLYLALLRQWLLTVNPNADTSAATLLASVACVGCLGAGIYDLLEIALLSAINDAL